MAIDHRVNGSVPVESASTAELVNRAVNQMGTLLRDEMALAKAEIAVKGKRLGVGGGLFGAAGLFAVYGIGLLLALCAVALDIVWPAWLAVLVVMVVVFAAAGVAALLGRAQMKKAAPPVPSEAVTGVNTDIHLISAAVKEGRHS